MESLFESPEETSMESSVESTMGGPGDKEKLKKTLEIYVNTATSGKYKNYDELNKKFPELNKFDKELLEVYVNTATSGKYKNYDEMNAKFPEFFGKDLKKKGGTKTPSKGGGTPGVSETPSMENKQYLLPTTEGTFREVSAEEAGKVAGTPQTTEGQFKAREVNPLLDKLKQQRAEQGIGVAAPTTQKTFVKQPGFGQVPEKKFPVPTLPTSVLPKQAIPVSEKEEAPIKETTIAPPTAKEKASEKDMEGNVFGYLYNKLLRGYGKMSAATTDAFFQLAVQIPGAVPEGESKDEALKKIRETMLPAIREGLEKKAGVDIGEKKQKQYDEGFVTGALGGLAESVPAMVTPYGTGLFLQAYDSGLESINSTEEGKKLPESYKSVYGVGNMIVQGALEKVGLDKIFGKGGTSTVTRKLTNKVFYDLMKKGEGAITKEAFEAAVNQEAKLLKNRALRVGEKTAKSFASEFLTGSAQETGAVAQEALTNELAGKQVFETKSFGETAGRIFKSGAAEGVGGVFLGGLAMPFDRAKNYIKDQVANAKTPEQLQKVKNEIVNAVENKKMTAGQAGQLGKLIDDYARANKKIPADVVNRSAVAEKILEKEQVQNQIALKEQELKSVDDAFKADIQSEIDILKDRANEINSEITTTEETGVSQAPKIPSPTIAGGVGEGVITPGEGSQFTVLQQWGQAAPTAEAPAAEKLPTQPITTALEEVVGDVVDYQGIQGTLMKDKEGNFIVMGDDGGETLVEGALSGKSADELGLKAVIMPEVKAEEEMIVKEGEEPAAAPVAVKEEIAEDQTEPIPANKIAYDLESNMLTLYGKKFEIDEYNEDDKGNVVSISVIDEKGKKKTIRNADAILEIEIQKEAASLPAPETITAETIKETANENDIKETEPIKPEVKPTEVGEAAVGEVQQAGPAEVTAVAEEEVTKPAEALKDVESTAKAFEEKGEDILYRGSDHPTIDVDKMGVQGTSYGFGVNLTTNPETAKYYAQNESGKSYIYFGKNKTENLNLIDYNKKPSADQINAIKKQAKKEGIEFDKETKNALDNGKFSDIRPKIFRALKYSSQKAVSEFLDRAGIDGVMYDNPEGTGKNYVIYNKNKVNLKSVELPSLSTKATQSIAESYHKAKEDGSNPELTKAVEDLLGEKPAAKPAEKVEAKEEMVAAAPKEGDTVELPPGNKYATANRVMVYKDGEWQQKVGGEATKVGATAQKMAADKWSGVAQEVAPAAEAPAKEVAPAAKPAEKAEAAKEPSAKKAGIKTIPNEVQAPIIKRLNKTIQKIFGKKENQIVSLGGKDWKDALEKAKKEENVNYQAVGIYEKIGFEETEEYQKLLKEGKFVENFDLKNIAGKPVVIINPDNMMTGVITTKDGTPIINGNGGINFVSKFGDVWASSDQETAQQLANYINEARELDIKNGGDGVVHILVTKGTLSKSLTSHTGAKGAMSVLESLVDKKLIGLKDFRKALIAVGKKYNIDFDGKEDAKSIHNDIKNKFFGVEDSTFSKRGTFIADIIDYLAENSNSVHENIEKIREALNSKELISEETGKPKKIAFSKGGIVDAIGLLFSDNITKGVPNSHVYATIEVSKPVKVIKEEKGGHESYPYHIKQEDNSRPILNSVSQKSHITDVVNDKNNNPVLKNIPKYKDGKPVLSPKGVHLTESGAGKLGSNQIGMARGFVKASEDLPNKNEVNYMTDSQGEIYGFEQNGNIFLNQDYVSSNPPIHEAGHIWTTWAEQNRPDLYEEGIKKVAKSNYLKDVKANKFYQDQAAKLPKNQQEIYYKKEALAKAIGDNGEKFATENERKNFKDWVMSMWRAVVKEYGIREVSAEEVAKMNIDEFSRKVAADIFGGKAEAPKAEPAKAEAKEIEYVPKDKETLRKFEEVDKADTKAEKAKSTAGKKKAESRKKEVINEVELSDRQKQIENEYNAMKEELEKLGIVKSKCK